MTYEIAKEQMYMARMPAIVLVGGTSASWSKLGGLPDLPEDFSWPVWNGEPLAFIAQLQLADLPRLPDLNLPVDGTLYFFNDPKDSESWRVVHVPARLPLSAARAPEGLDTEAIYGARQVSFEMETTFPSLERLDQDWMSSAPEAIQAFDDLDERSGLGLPLHQIGGYPVPMQADAMELQAEMAFHGLTSTTPVSPDDPSDGELAAGAKDWQLLLQVDTDDDLGMMWGDCGRLYFWIRKQDLDARDFSAVRLILQGC